MSRGKKILLGLAGVVLVGVAVTVALLVTRDTSVVAPSQSSEQESNTEVTLNDISTASIEEIGQKYGDVNSRYEQARLSGALKESVGKYEDAKGYYQYALQLQGLSESQTKDILIDLYQLAVVSGDDVLKGEMEQRLGPDGLANLKISEDDERSVE